MSNKSVMAGLKVKVVFFEANGGLRWKCSSSVGERIARGTRVFKDAAVAKEEVRKVLRGYGDDQVYQDIRGQWRFRVVDADTKRIVAISSEAYHNKTDCRRALALLIGANS